MFVSLPCLRWETTHDEFDTEGSDDGHNRCRHLPSRAARHRHLGPSDGDACGANGASLGTQAPLCRPAFRVHPRPIPSPRTSISQSGCPIPFEESVKNLRVHVNIVWRGFARIFEVPGRQRESPASPSGERGLAAPLAGRVAGCVAPIPPLTPSRGPLARSSGAAAWRVLLAAGLALRSHEEIALRVTPPSLQGSRRALVFPVSSVERVISGRSRRACVPRRAGSLASARKTSCTYESAPPSQHNRPGRPRPMPAGCHAGPPTPRRSSTRAGGWSGAGRRRISTVQLATRNARCRHGDAH